MEDQETQHVSVIFSGKNSISHDLWVLMSLTWQQKKLIGGIVSTSLKNMRNRHLGWWWVPSVSGKNKNMMCQSPPTKLWQIPSIHGKTHYTWPFSIATLVITGGWFSGIYRFIYVDFRARSSTILWFIMIYVNGMGLMVIFWWCSWDFMFSNVFNWIWS